jgi:hypothetical protein
MAFGRLNHVGGTSAAARGRIAKGWLAWIARDPRVGLVACILLALGLRATDLTATSFSLDESYNAWVVEHAGRYFAAFMVDHHPPDWYALVGLWTRVVGPSDLAGRFLSVIAGVALVATTWSIAHRLGGPRAALIAAALSAAWPLLVLEQRELYMYAWLPLGTAAVMLALLSAADRDRPRDWALAGFAASLLAGLHLFGALCAAGLLIGSWGSRRSSGPAFATAIAVLAYLPVLDLLARWPAVVAPGPSQGLGPGAYLRLATGLVFGERGDADPTALLVATLVVVAAAAIGFTACRGARGIFAGALLGGLVLPVAVSALALDYPLTPRYFIAVLPVVIVATAVAFAALPRVAGPIATGALVLGFVIASRQLVAEQAAQSVDWRSLATQLATRTTDEAVIRVAPAYIELPLRRYYHGPLDVIGVPERYVAGQPTAAATRADLSIATSVPAWLVVRDDLVSLRPPEAEDEGITALALHVYRLPGSNGK